MKVVGNKFRTVRGENGAFISNRNRYRVMAVYTESRYKVFALLKKKGH